MIDKSYPIAEKSGSIRDTKENRYLSFLFEILKDWLMNERWKSKCCWKMIMILIWSVEKLIEEGWKSRCSFRDDNDFDLECRKIDRRGRKVEVLLRDDNDNDWKSRRMCGICGKYICKYLKNASGMQINKIFFNLI